LIEQPYAEIFYEVTFSEETRGCRPSKEYPGHTPSTDRSRKSHRRAKHTFLGCEPGGPEFGVLPPGEVFRNP
jgi:hypothetical protein